MDSVLLNRAVKRAAVVIQLHSDRSQNGGFKLLGLTHYDGAFKFSVAHEQQRRVPLVEGPVASIRHDFRGAMMPLGSELLFEVDARGYRDLEVPWLVVVLADAEVDEDHRSFVRFREVISGPGDEWLERQYGTLRDAERLNFAELLPGTPLFLFDQRRVGEISKVLKWHSCRVQLGEQSEAIPCFPHIGDTLAALHKFRKEYGTICEAG